MILPRSRNVLLAALVLFTRTAGEEVVPYFCEICSEGLVMTNPNATVVVPLNPNQTCEYYENLGAAGEITENSCNLLLRYTEDVCCMNWTDVNNTNATFAPTNFTWPPSNFTFAPTNETETDPPTEEGTGKPTASPSATNPPTFTPTNDTDPTMNFTLPPTNAPTVSDPPTLTPTNDTDPSMNITLPPTNAPTVSDLPTLTPTNDTDPSMNFTLPPTNAPTVSDPPTFTPTNDTDPSMNFTLPPTNAPTVSAPPTFTPTNDTDPSTNFTLSPSNAPTVSDSPTSTPTNDTDPSMNFTLPPTTAPTVSDPPTFTPMNFTLPPSNSPTVSAPPTFTPTNDTDPSMNVTLPPTNAPTVSDPPTFTPTNDTDPSMNTTLPPTNDIDPSTLPPTIDTDPKNVTLPPTEETGKPTVSPNATDPPTFTPTNATEPPMNITLPPTNATDPPTNATDPPTNATDAPTNAPTNATEPPTDSSTDSPSPEPSGSPTRSPTPAPTTPAPTDPDDTGAPTGAATPAPTNAPTGVPSVEPTRAPIIGTQEPTIFVASESPTEFPSAGPSPGPTTKAVVADVKGLEMKLDGIGSMSKEEQNEWSLLTVQYMTEYYKNNPDEGVSLFESEIFINKVEGSDTSGNRIRKLQSDGSFVRIFYNQEITYQSDNPDTSATDIVAQPFAGTVGASGYLFFLESSDTFTDVIGFFQTLDATDPPETEEPTPPPTSELTEEPEKKALSTGAIVGIAVGCGVLLIGLLLYFFFMSGGRDDYADNEPPHNIGVRPGGDEVSTLAPPNVPLGASGVGGGDQSFAGYGDQSVATVDYDYSKAYGGAGDTSVSSAGGTFGSNTQNNQPSALDPASAAATGAALGGFADADSFEQHYRDPTANVKEELINVFAPPGKLGVVIDTPDDGAPVVHAVKDSSVIADKIQVGDKLVAVDDEDVRSMTAIKVSKLISRKSANPSRKLSIIRTTVIE